MLGASRASLAAAQGRLTQLAGSGGVDLDALSVDLFAVATLLSRELPLRRAMADPSTDERAKAALVNGLLGPRVTPPALALLVELVGSRWSRPHDLVDAVETLAVLASFEQANNSGDLDDVEDQLFRFGRIIERDNGLRDALSDRNLPDERKRELLEALLADKVGPMALRVISAAAMTSGRRHIAAALDSFSRLAAELRERVNARVTLAVEPDPDQMERLAQELSRVYGRRIGLRIEVDPTIVGGLVIRVGDQILDATIRRRLEGARRGLAPRY